MCQSGLFFWVAGEGESITGNITRKHKAYKYYYPY